jgi:hypothetical protein
MNQGKLAFLDWTQPQRDTVGTVQSRSTTSQQPSYGTYNKVQQFSDRHFGNLTLSKYCLVREMLDVLKSSSYFWNRTFQKNIII